MTTRRTWRGTKPKKAPTSKHDGLQREQLKPGSDVRDRHQAAQAERCAPQRQRVGHREGSRAGGWTTWGSPIEATLRGGCSVLAKGEQRERRDRNVFVARVGEDELVGRRALEKAEAGWLIPSDAADKRT